MTSHNHAAGRSLRVRQLETLQIIPKPIFKFAVSIIHQEKSLVKAKSENYFYLLQDRLNYPFKRLGSFTLAFKYSQRSN